MSRMDADLFRYFRKEHNMTRKDLARVLDLHYRTIEDIESGRVRPSRSTEEKLAALTAKHEASRSEHAE